MKFDSNLAWKQASAAISGNRDVVLALAGVFFLLPTLALTLLFPQPEPNAAMAQEAMMAMFSEYYLSMLPVLIPMVLFQAAGTLALIALMTDRARPTVREAIELGVKGIVPYFVAQILLGIAIGLAGGLTLAVAGASGVGALVTVAIAAVAIVVVYTMVRMSLVAPVIVVERQRNPMEALRRSWALTQGNALRILLFFALVFLAFAIAIAIVTALLGIVLTLVAGAEVAKIVMAVVSSGFSAIVALYFVAIFAAIHRQLAGPPPRADSAAFE